MAKRNIDAERIERREAGKAVAEAKRVGRDAARLAKTLSVDERSSLEAVAVSADAEVRAARNALGVRPRRAKRAAQKAAARLRKASVQAVGSRVAERRALAKIDAKQQAQATKRRRTQVKQAQQMVKFVTSQLLASSVTTPSDAEHAEHAEHAENAEKAQKRARRRTKAPPRALAT